MLVKQLACYFIFLKIDLKALQILQLKLTHRAFLDLSQIHLILLLFLFFLFYLLYIYLMYFLLYFSLKKTPNLFKIFFLRCTKLARTISKNNFSFFTSTSFFAFKSKCKTLDVTLGCGRKTVLGTSITSSACV